MSEYNVIHGDCLDVMATMEENSVDAIVTDPPYGLGFMGKHWDHGVPGVEFWQAALTVAKPGAHLLAFGGTRTFHRLAVAIEDAGWELRDTVMWVYGCLSDDTEILTKDGWRHFDISTKCDTIMDKEILVYDIQKDVYKWEKPERWNYYRVQQDTAYRIQSDYTDQIVSRGHRCLVERGGKLEFVSADKLANLEYMPTLPNNFFGIPDKHQSVLQPRVQRTLPWKRVGTSRAQRTKWLDGNKSSKLSKKDDWIKQSSVERRSNSLQTQGKVCRSIDKICALSTRVYGYGTQRWLRNGASVKSSTSDQQTFTKFRSSTSYQSRCNGQSSREFSVVCIKLGSQKIRTRTSYRTDLATVTAIKYTGLIWCPTVSTGAFVARRNGKVFITGNSGFPKSHDVSKAIDREAGAQREVVGKSPWFGRNPNGRKLKGEIRLYGLDTRTDEEAGFITAPATPEAQAWSGWGTGLKPAWEPILVARKPFPGTVAQNVLTYGTGAINVDACRIGTYADMNPRDFDDTMRTSPKFSGKFNGGKEGQYLSRYGAIPNGRWPSNLIIDDSEEVQEIFPKNNSRFFYCAKSSKTDREEGVEHLPLKMAYDMVDREEDSAGLNSPRAGAGRTSGAHNHHPTVKPTSLMAYLCRLVTPPNGLVLDPFCGSGSTGKAAILEGFRFVGIEKEEEYIDIAKARIEFALNTRGSKQMGLFDE